MPETTWENAPSPNYDTNVDKLYPYSELPYLDYKVVKIPFCTENLIKHVDYFGQGRTETCGNIIGFADCYNVNYEYALVKDGPDAGRKIPNRIPLSRDNYYGTHKHIKNNSVITVTVSLCHDDFTLDVAQDVARIVNGRQGKVIAYNFTEAEDEILREELKIAKQLFYCPVYILPDNLQLSYYNTAYKTYLSMNEIKRELYRNVARGDIDAAVLLTECLNNAYSGNAISDVVNKLIANKIANVIGYAYKLWNNNSKEVILKHFPKVFQQIFKGDCMVIVNKQYNQALVLEHRTKLAHCDSQYKSSKKMGWRIIPEWGDNNVNVVFNLYNVDSNMFLKLSPGLGDCKEGKAYGSEDSQDPKDKFYLEPLMMNGQVAFTISSCEHAKTLKLPVDIDSSDDKAVLGHKAGGSEEDDRSRWILAASNEKVSDDLSVEDSDSEICLE